MAFKTQTCVVLSCDLCGEPQRGYEESYVVHHDSEAEALKEARDTEWMVLDEPNDEGHQHICEGCTYEIVAAVRQGDGA